MNGMKRIIASALAIAAAATFASCGTEKPRTNVTSSAGLEKYASWLGEKVVDDRDVFVGIAGDGGAYGIDMSAFQAEGYVIRSVGDETVVIGADEVGVDRGVHELARHADEIGYEKTYNEGYRVKRMTLAGYDISEYTIVIPADADENVRFAAEQMRDYTAKACGVVLPIANADAAHMIKFVKDESGELGDEGFTIAADDGQMTVTHGRYRGALFGAYEFLERYMGWRFVPDLRYREEKNIDYLYEADMVDIPSGTLYTKAGGDIATREIYDFFNHNVDYSVKVKYSSERIQSNKKYGGFGIVRWACHGLEGVGIDDDLYFQNGQVCFTDEENIEFITDWSHRSIEDKIASGQVIGRDFCAFDIAQFDGEGWCSCQKCRELCNSEGSQAASMLYMSNTVAQSFEEDHPDLYLNVLVYCSTVVPPVSMKPHKMLSLSYCFYIDGGNWVCMSHGYDGKDCEYDDVRGSRTGGNKRFAEMFEQWCSYGNRVDVWLYDEMYYQCVPTPDLSLMRENIAYLVDHGCDGVVFLNGFEYYEALEGYLLLRLCWDSHISEEDYLDMIREVFVINFGEAAGEDMYEYYLLWDRSGRLGGCSATLKADPEHKVDMGFYSKKYDDMIFLFDDAMANAPTSRAEYTIEELSLHMDLCGILSRWDGWTVSGTSEQRAFIDARYRGLYKRAMKHSYVLNTDGATFPAEGMDFTVNPMEYILLK